MYDLTSIDKIPENGVIRVNSLLYLRIYDPQRQTDPQTVSGEILVCPWFLLHFQRLAVSPRLSLWPQTHVSCGSVVLVCSFFSSSDSSDSLPWASAMFSTETQSPIPAWEIRPMEMPRAPGAQIQQWADILCSSSKGCHSFAQMWGRGKVRSQRDLVKWSRGGHLSCGLV